MGLPIRRGRMALVLAAGTFLVFLAVLSCAAFFGPSNQNEMPRQELVKNRGFEVWDGKMAGDWFRDESKTGKKGDVAQDRQMAHSGHASLVLRPNSRNNGGPFPLAIAQVIPAAAFRGKQVEFSGQIRAEGGARAVLGMLNFTGRKASNLTTVSSDGAGAEWAFRSSTYDVPDDGSVQLVITCFVEGTSGAAWFDDVSVSLAASGPRPPSLPEVSSGTSDTGAGPVLQAAVKVDATRVIRRIPRELYGTNVEWIWNGNLLWQEKSRSFDPDLERLTRDLGVSLFRYPGGHFSDFYSWRDGVGPYEKRPEARHEAGKNDKSRPNFGTDEALEFARKAGGELMITVNAGTGNAQEAGDWVRYVAGKREKVRFWEVGNELYTKDNSPIQKATATDPKAYAERFKQFAMRMREADPSIRVGAIGGENEGKYANVTYANWNQIVLQNAGAEMDFLAVHNAYAPVVLGGDEKADLRTVYTAMMAAPTRIARNLARVTEQIHRYVPQRASQIRLAVTEWGPAFQFDARSRYVDHSKTLGSALFVASTLKAFIESPQTDIANFFLLNDLSVMGWIGSRNGRFPPQPEWYPTARYFAFQMFTRHFGTELVQSDTRSPNFSSREVGFTDAEQNVPYLDVVSSLSEDGQSLFILAVNKHFDSAIDASLDLKGFRPAPQASVWTLNGSGVDANTGTTVLAVPGLRWAKQAEDARRSRFYQGGPGEIQYGETKINNASSQFTYRFAAHSVTSLILKRTGGRSAVSSPAAALRNQHANSH